MRIRAVVVAACAGLALGVAVVPASAQARSAPPSEPKANVAVMYSYEHLEGNAPFGIAVDVSEKMSQISPTTNVQAVMQFAYNDFSHGSADFMFGGGARLGFTKQGSFTPFFHVMAALTHCCDSNWFTVLVGGGTDIRFSSTSRMKMRIDGNWVILFADGPQSGIRLNVGVVIPFGKK